MLDSVPWRKTKPTLTTDLGGVMRKTWKNTTSHLVSTRKQNWRYCTLPEELKSANSLPNSISCIIKLLFWVFLVIALLFSHSLCSSFVEGEKTGMKITLETSGSILKKTNEENVCLKEKVEVLNQRIHEVTETNNSLVSKLQAAENNTISLERQLLDLNLLQANHRDANRQDILLSGVKVSIQMSSVIQ